MTTATRNAAALHAMPAVIDCVEHADDDQECAALLDALRVLIAVASEQRAKQSPRPSPIWGFVPPPQEETRETNTESPF